MLDIVFIVNIILGNSEFNSNADLNGDGGINIQDVILTINIILFNGLGEEVNLLHSGYVNKTLKVDIANYPKGIYFIEIKSKKNSKIQHILFN